MKKETPYSYLDKDIILTRMKRDYQSISNISVNVSEDNVLINFEIKTNQKGFDVFTPYTLNNKDICEIAEKILSEKQIMVKEMNVKIEDLGRLEYEFKGVRFFLGRGTTIMDYHTNHCYCSESIHNGDFFDGEAMVSFGGTLSSRFLSDNKLYMAFDDLDFPRLTKQKDFYDEEAFDILIDLAKEKEKKLDEDDISFYKQMATKTTVTLKKEVIDWLNENVADRKGSDENTPINKRKAWSIGDDKYNSHQWYKITVFFVRQQDALNFIKKWSIYNKPTTYFDYFHEDSREMNIKEILEKTNMYRKSKGLKLVDIGDKVNIPHKTSTDLNPETFTMIDWENDVEEV